MRFATRDLIGVLVLQRIEHNTLRLDAPEQYAEAEEKFAVISPLQGKLQAEIYGERIVHMLRMQASWQVGLGAKVIYKDKDYKVIARDDYQKHTEYVLERID